MRKGDFCGAKYALSQALNFFLSARHFSSKCGQSLTVDADYCGYIQQNSPLFYLLCTWSKLYTYTNTYRLLEGTWRSARMAEAFKACITASFMQISVVSAWRLRQKRFCACHTGSRVPQSPAASKTHLNLSRRQSQLTVLPLAF